MKANNKAGITSKKNTDSQINKRTYPLNMPQMLHGGLSENWFLKELGDIHWFMITEGLKTASDQLTDSTGERLYASFVRIRWQSDSVLATFRENEALSLDSKLSRYGEKMFFSNCEAVCSDKKISSSLMTVFASRKADNTSLTKASPLNVKESNIMVHKALPQFGLNYLKTKTNLFSPSETQEEIKINLKQTPFVLTDTSLFTIDYSIDSYEDLNGVSLLYFVSYPKISDKCELTYFHKLRDALGIEGNWAMVSSPIARDIYYFGNANPGEELVYELNDCEYLENYQLKLSSSLYRKKGKQLIAKIFTIKQLVTEELEAENKSNFKKLWEEDIENILKSKPKRDNSNKNDHPGLEQLNSKLIELLKPMLGVSDITPSTNLKPFGLESVALTELSEQLNNEYKIKSNPSKFYAFTTINQIAEYISETFFGKNAEDFSDHNTISNASLDPVQKETENKKEVREEGSSDDIAIIGVSGRFPGAENLHEFWDNLMTGKDCISEIPEDRWKKEDYYEYPLKSPNKTNSKWGGFLKDIKSFDPGFFNISPREAELMDPQQRLLLEEVWHMIEHAGYDATGIAGSQTGVFIGVCHDDYNELLIKNHLNPELYDTSGTSFSVIPNRISYFLDLQGPSLAIDTACSSSLIAVHQAVQSIRNGESSMAIAGGVNICCTPRRYLTYGQAGMLADDGRCKTFDKNANGYVRGEGLGVVLLKSLAKAEADGDRIYAVIKGSAVNHGGLTSSLTVPNPNAQADLLTKAYRKAGFDPSTITHIETHGTGTRLGDPIEINGLKEAFKELQKDKEKPDEAYCSLGSVKTHIGHLESAAGIAGLIKVILSLQNKKLPGNLNFKEQNPYIELEDSPFRILKEAEAWKRLKDEKGKDILRRAGISSFGSGGANAHVVLEEYEEKKLHNYQSQSPAIILLSAKNEERLKEHVQNLKDHLEQNKDLDLYDIAYTMQVGREAMEQRLAFEAKTHGELITKLTAYLNGKAENVFSGNIRHTQTDLLLEGEPGRAYIQTAIDTKNTKTLAQLWVKGAIINWELLYRADHKPGKIDLPKYPFSKKHYWLPEEKISTHTGQSHMLHPLLHSNESDLREQKYCSIYTGTESYLSDHKVQGRKVLPGVAYLELAREAGVRSIHKQISQIKDVTWLSPIHVNGSPEKVFISMFEEGDSIAYEVYSEKEEELLHSQGKLITKKQTLPSPYDLSSIKKRLKKSKEKQACYSFFEDQGLKYGPAFQGIKTLYYSDQEALSKISLTREEGYVLQPGILDSALQTSVGLMLGRGQQGLSLPFSVKEVNIYEELPAELWCYARKSANSKEGSKIDSYDIDLLNASGEVLLNFKDFVALPLSTTKKTKEDSNKASLHLYSNQWKEKEVVTENDSVEQEELVILAGGSATLADKLQEVLEVEVLAVSTSDEETYFLELLKMVQDKLKTKTSSRITLLHRNSDFHTYGFISGLFKTVRLENPKVQGKVVGVDSLSLKQVEELTKIVNQEWNTKNKEVRYREGIREEKGVDYFDINNEDSVSNIKEGGIYLITGGAGGLGRIFATHISETPDTKIILTGRSKLSKAQEQEIRKYNAEYYPCDVSDKKAVVELITTIKEKYEKVDGIIHSAGVIRDSFLLKKTEEEVRAVLSPKVQGAKNLDEATKDEALDFMIYFSSITSILGNAGQGDYASANTWLDNYAEKRNQLVATGKRQGHTMSINWPLWEDGGMQVDEETKKWLEKQWGMQALPVQEGLSALEILLNQGIKQGTVAYGHGDKIAKALKIKAENSHSLHKVTTKAIQVDQYEIEQRLIKLTSDLLKLDIEDIETDVDFSEYGTDSIMMIKFLNVLENTFKVTPEPTALINYPTIEKLANYLLEEISVSSVLVGSVQSLPEKTISPEKRVRDDISASVRKRFTTTQKALPANNRVAIIGMSCRLPGSDDLMAFWDNLSEGKDLITDTPGDRWDSSLWYSQELAPDKTYTTKGGFINSPGLFDSSYFKVSDESAIAMDPQQRLMLELSRDLLAHAGYHKQEILGTNTGVYIGAKDNNYLRNSYHLMEKEVFQHTIVNSISNMIAARISDFYDLKATSQVIDTACSSSLVAIHEACEAITTGKITMAIAGGVYLMTDPFFHIGFSQAEVLSKDGKSYVFDERANGFVLGEGGALVLLKSYEQAIKDGDRILGVIAGSATNNDGQTVGLTVPNKEGQKKVIEMTLDKAGINPETITYYEAHGTGTLLGDPIEVKAATEVYQSKAGSNNAQYCAMGAVKSNLGHNMTAAGVTGLIKILLQMQHGKLVPTLNCDKPHPRFGFEKSPFYPNTRLKDWQITGDQPRTAAISSFGFGGTNCHMIIQEANHEKLNIKRTSLPIERISSNYYWLGHEIEKEEPNLPQADVPAALNEIPQISSLETAITEYLREEVGRKLQIPPEEIGIEEGFLEQGMNSTQLINITNEFADKVNIDLYPTALFEYDTILKLSAYLSEEFAETLSNYLNIKSQKEESPAVRKIKPVVKRLKKKAHNIQPLFNSFSNKKEEQIAIVGMSGRFPGSPDLTTFWKNIKANKDLITEIPKDRWDWKKYYGDPQEDENKTKAKWGGFIKDIDKFDPLFFNISPREAKLMDPQQRITLEAVYHALEDAGISLKSIKGSNAGVFIGVSTSDYSTLINKETNESSQAQYATGKAHSVLSNRISYLLDIHGPSQPIDTACSSSLIAIHRAVENMRNGHCNMAIVGGVNALLSPELTLSFSRAGMLSDDGRCKTFDKEANGYVRGEGVGVIILKPLSQAERDGDHIYATIRSTAENHGGKANTLTSPNPNAQRDLLLKAYQSAKVNPKDVSYIEAHGTGTKLGDPVEVEGLKLAFKELYKNYAQEEPETAHISLGSIKANIGHLESAAGIAGIIKVILSLQHHKIPGNPQLNEANEYLKLSNTPFRLQKETTDWETSNDKPRLAGVSSFGFGGSNAHVIVEEYQQRKKNTFHSEDPAVVVLSAKNEEGLRAHAQKLKAHLEEKKELNIYDIAYTLQAGRDAMEERLALIVKSTDELVEKLTNYLEKKADDFLTGNIKKDKQDFLLKGGAGQAYINYALENKELESLAQLWVTGVAIDWKLFYNTENKPNKISLPTYPFARNRYWYKDKEQVFSRKRLIVEENIIEEQVPDFSVSLSNAIDSSLSKPEVHDHKIQLKSITTEAHKIELEMPDTVVTPSSPVIKQEEPKEIEKVLAQMISEALYIEVDEIDRNEKFADIGLDSVIGVELIKNINEHFHTKLEVTDMYNYPTVTTLSKTIARQLPAQEQTKTTVSANINNPAPVKLEITDTVVAPSSLVIKQEESEEIEEVLTQMISEALYIEADEIDPNEKFADIGLDSVIGVELIKNINEHFHTKLEVTDMYNYPTVTTLSKTIARQLPAQEQTKITVSSNFNTPAPVKLKTPVIEDVKKAIPSLKKADQKESVAEETDIAIIGLSGIFPGAENVDLFWDQLKSGKDLVKEVPGERWNVDAYYDTDIKAIGKSNGKWMGALQDIDKFDPLFFNISPYEAKLMDPQQRLFLQQSWKAIEEGGYNPKKLSESICSVFIGVGPGDYYSKDHTDDLDAYTLTGNSSAILSARISYLLNFKGPSMALDTACSSSLVAISRACDSLVKGESEMAIAGGVCIMTTPALHIMTGKAGMLSSKGKSYIFDQRADGFVPSEAVGILLLKRLKDAQRDGDNIRGVIKGWGVNQNGSTNGITAPNDLSQSELQKKVYDDFNISPETITYIETAANGSALGDAIEVKALKSSFANYTDKTDYCAIGSVKSNIGHALTASGVTGIIKVLLSFKHKQIPPTIHHEKLHEHITLDGSPFYINTTLQDWHTPNGAFRRAAVNSFGFSGTNAHLVLEEYTDKLSVEHDETNVESPVIILLSAKNQERLKEQATNLRDHLETTKNVSVHDIAYTLQTGREEMEERLALVVKSREELLTSLESYLKGETSDLLHGNTKNANSNFILEGNAGKAYIECAIREKESKSLARLWVNGITIDWNLLYTTGKKPNKVSLPTYPFAREPYWFTNKNHNQETTAIHKLHPLVHYNSSNLKEQKFTSTYTGKESFLADHKVKGKKVLPGVAYLELARMAGSQSAEEKVTQLKDIIWMRPISVNGHPEKVHISLSENGEYIDYEVFSKKNDEEYVHSQGKLITKKQDQPAAYDITSIKERCASSKRKEECYDLFERKGLHYGKTLQGIEMLHYNREEALSRIILPREEDFALQPGILDSALQTCMGLNIAEEQELVLPFSVKEVNIYEELSSDLWCYARKSAGNNNKHTQSYDIDLLNGVGEVLVNFKGLVVLPVNGLAKEKQKTESKLLNTHLYKNSWQIREAVTVTNKAKNLILLAGGSANLVSRLQEKLDANVIALESLTTETYFLNVLEKTRSALGKKQSTNIILVCRNKDYKNYGFVSGLFKTAHLENPKITGKIVGVDSLSLKNLDSLTTILKTEQFTKDSEVSYKEGIREAKTIEPVSTSEDKENIALKEGGVYLITGGAGGLGMIFAEHISQKVDATIILTGRSRDAGSSVPTAPYYPCDVTDKKSVEVLINDIINKYGKLNGVIHSAGVIKDNFIQKKTEEEALTVLSPKIQGAKYLDEATRDKDLDFMIYFSSVAGLLGNVGQCDYASANAFLDNYALYRNELVAQGKRQGHTLSINWPLWEQGGMQIDDETRAHFEKKWGLRPLPNEEGLEAFERLLVTGVSQGIVVYGEESKLSRTLQNKNEVVYEKEQATADHDTQEVINTLLHVFSEMLMLDRSDLETDVDLSDYGVDSIMMIKLLGAIEDRFNIVADPTAIMNYPTIDLLAEYIKSKTAAHTKEDKDVVQKQDLSSEHRVSRIKGVQRTRPGKNRMNGGKVAIIGMSCKLPQSDNLEAYWNNLQAGKNLITDTPPDRWDASKHYSEERLPDKTYTTKGGFVNNPGLFDAKYFNVGDANAVTMDPQQRLILELARDLWAHAGYQKEELKATKTSIYIGAKDNNYCRNHYHMLPENAFQHVMVNSISNMIAARISDFYDLRGESKVIDTACSSSLVAIHEACENILAGKTDMAIAGGITILSDAFMHISLSQAGVLSGNGKSYVFDERANGFVLGEGGGLVLLKDYQKALEDGDRILGVISGSAVNNDGHTMGVTVPNMEGQKGVIKEALKKAQISPAEITYYEAHGTGTLLGDPIEVKAATEVYQSITGNKEEKQYCAIGSSKSNLGHTMMAAGITGLIKILLQMQHNQLVPTLHCERPHPRFQFEKSPFYPNTVLQEWKHDKKVAAISSFGFGGTNAHMIIEKPDGENSEVVRSPLSVERRSQKYYWPGYEIE